MTAIRLTEENMEEFGEWLTPDVAENLGREYYRGYVVRGDDGAPPLAGMVYEVLNTEDEEPTEAAIRWLKIEDEAAAAPLFEAYQEAARSEDVRRTRFVIALKGSEKETAALKKAGFTVRLNEGDNIIVSLQELKNMAIMSSRAVPENICSLNQLTARVFRRVLSRCAMLGRKGVCEDLSYLPLSWFEPNVSCYSEKDGDINGLLLFHKLPSGMLAIQLMTVLTADPQAILLGMMRKFVISLEENYGPDVRVVLNRHNQLSMQLSEKLLPRGFGIPVYAGSREE